MNNNDDWFNENVMHEGTFRGLLIVSDYVSARWALVEQYPIRSETPYRDSAIKTLYGRIVALLRTLERLNDPIHFQGVVSATRSLLEILVDLIHLHYDKTNEKGWKMYWWAESEKMQVCENTVAYYRNKGLSIPDMHLDREAAYLRDKNEIDQKRAILWPGKKIRHPDRWTGQGRSIKSDLIEADKLHGHLVKDDLGMTLEEFYCTEYKRMCWQVHSGLASSLNLPQEAFPIICGLAFYQCASLGMSAAKIVLNDFGSVNQLPQLKDGWEQVKEARARCLAATMSDTQ